MWNTLGGFIRTQALVSFIDAFFIGAGLLIPQVPLAGVLTVITFMGGFIPIVGAFVAGALAVLIALVTNGMTTALIVLGIILAVQQLEGNVLQPWLQAKSMDLHAVVVLLAVTLGGTLFGITGAFLAVPPRRASRLRCGTNEQIADRAGRRCRRWAPLITEAIGEDYELTPDDDGPPARMTTPAPTRTFPRVPAVQPESRSPGGRRAAGPQRPID